MRKCLSAARSGAQTKSRSARTDLNRMNATLARHDDRVARLRRFERRLLVRAVNLDRREAGVAERPLDFRGTPAADLHPPRGHELDRLVTVGVLAERRRHEDDAAGGRE